MIKKKRGYERKKSLYGFLFVLHWIIGFAAFFLVPLVQSLIFVFSDVSITNEGFSTAFTGLSNLKYVFYESAKFVENLTASLTDFVYKVPIILVISLIIAVVLNGKFKGKTVFRSLFFIPVIISTGVVMQYIAGDSVMESMRSSGESASNMYSSGLIDFNAVFMGLGIPDTFTNIVMGFIDGVFDLIWNSGIQIVLFIMGLQSIPDQLYEVSKVEGATKWEEFWYITVPMLRHSIILVVSYTAIEFCSSESNKAMSQAFTLLMDNQVYNYSSAMMWSFFAIVGVIFGAVLFLAYKFIFKKWE